MTKKIYKKYEYFVTQYFNNEFDNGNDLYTLALNFEKEGKLILLWGSALYGRLCTEVHNYIISEVHLDTIIDDFGDYGKFEDGIWEIFKNMIEKIKRERS